MSARSKVGSLLVLSLVFGFSALRATPARAQASTGELRDEPTRMRLAGEVGVYNFDQDDFDFDSVQPSFYGSFRIADIGNQGFLDIDAAWRFAGTTGDISAFRAGNPYVGLRAGVHDVENGWRVRGGLGVTAPLMNAYDDYANPGDLEAIATIGYGAAMQGEWDQWLLRPLTSSIVARGDFEYRQRYFDLGVEAGFAAMLPVEYRGQTGDTVFALQGAAWAAGRPIEQLAIGARFQAVMAASESDAEGYLALMPYVRGEFGRGFIEGRWMLNLDEPLGPFVEEGGVWGAYVTGGAAF